MGFFDGVFPATLAHSKFFLTHFVNIAKHTKVGMIWVAGRSPTLVSQNLKATTLTYLAILTISQIHPLAKRGVSHKSINRGALRMEVLA
jgi:hypothetical protein